MAKCWQIFLPSVHTAGDPLQQIEQEWGVEKRIFSKRNLEIYPVKLSVLVLNFRSHVLSHVPQVADHGGHLLHVLFHLFLAIVICDPGAGKSSSLESKLLNNFAVILRHQKLTDQFQRYSTTLANLHKVRCCVRFRRSTFHGRRIYCTISSSWS